MIKIYPNMVILVLLSLMVDANAANQVINKLCDATCNAYIQNLKSENPGVRNSAIFQIMKIKSRYPEQEIRPFISILKRITEKDYVILNRTHAYFAIICLNNPSILEYINPFEFEDPQLFFRNVHDYIIQYELIIS
ncbi:hypothetical protein JW964_14520 [candidate division KSB1 bacterium]|nr:hypothetical protein [candidate division KSB1 bacterium]